jgi:hypothetical protein
MVGVANSGLFTGIEKSTAWLRRIVILGCIVLLLCKSDLGVSYLLDRFQYDERLIT